MPILSSSKQWSNMAKAQDRQRTAAFRRREADRRRARHAARQDTIHHPVRAFFRWAVR